MDRGIFEVHLKGLLTKAVAQYWRLFLLVNVSQTVFSGIFAFLDVAGVFGA